MLRRVLTILPPDTWLRMLAFMVRNPAEGPCASPVPLVLMMAKVVSYELSCRRRRLTVTGASSTFLDGYTCTKLGQGQGQDSHGALREIHVDDM